MRIESDVKLDFADVLLKPKRSTIESRKDIDLTRTFKFRYGVGEWTGVPIISANMASVTTPAVAEVLDKHKMLACIPKNRELDFAENVNAFPSVGLGPLKAISHQFSWVALDVPNGYLERVIDQTKAMREAFPYMTIIVGNVVSAEATEALIIAGADIVKVGIGCFASGTRVLMANMTYKNIEAVRVGDRVINMHGKPTLVTSTQNSGLKEVGKVEHVGSPQSTFVTPDHKFYMGVLDSQSDESLAAKGYKASLLQKAKTTPKSNKIVWVPVSGPEKAVALFPSDIVWELPETFSLDISKYFQRKDMAAGYKTTIEPSYNLGYIFGTFLGDGYANLSQSRLNSRSGQLGWIFGLQEMKIAEKVVDCLEDVFGKAGVIEETENTVRVHLYSKQLAEWFAGFGKKSNKKLPDELLCNNEEYLLGLFDGLNDSDGCIDGKDPRDSFHNTSLGLIELYGLLHFRLLGYLPQFCRFEPTMGGLKNCNLDNCNESFQARSLGSPERRLLPERGLGIIKITDRNFDNLIVTQTWDIEVEDDSHSFIANNAIVHNSGAACSTRIKTGVGMPQLSAVIECADAAHGLQGHIISDGGCQSVGDIAKAFCAGSDFVMLGSILAGHEENGEDFYGSSSERGNDETSGGLKDYRAAEGWEIKLPARGPLEKTLQDIEGGLRSAGSYIGARSIKEFSKCATFIQVNRQANQSLWEHRT